MMITDINKFNEVECQSRNEKITATHDYDEFKSQMQKRLKEQQANAKRSETTLMVPPNPKGLDIIIRKAVVKTSNETPIDLKRKPSVTTTKLANAIATGAAMAKRQRTESRVFY
jgi:hypothetical protein